MHNSEILKKFDETRDLFKPYGLTCELWAPTIMSKPDRHNEIEVNFFSGSTITYLLRGEKITVPSGKLAVFWGLIPHQIVGYEGIEPYYVCTIPFSVFLEWNLPGQFVDRILKGELLLEADESYSTYDKYMFDNWIRDLDDQEAFEIVVLEIRARLGRLALSYFSGKKSDTISLETSQVNHVEKMAVFISKNYQNQISVSDIGQEVGLHPDYANSIFKKTFGSTLSEYIIEERIANAQRKLITTELNISQIAYECGFNSLSWFNTTFKKIIGCTPKEYKKVRLSLN